MNIIKQKGFQGLVLILLLILGTIFYSRWKINYRLGKESKFTIIQIERKQYFDNGDPMAHFHLNYQNKIYDLGFTIHNAFNGDLNEGDRLFIQFSPKDPTVFKVLEEPKVPKNLIAPENGWDSIPIGNIPR